MTGGDEIRVDDPPPEQHRLDMLAWTRVKSRWSPDTQMEIVHEFLMANRLFAQLVEFARKRR